MNQQPETTESIVPKANTGTPRSPWLNRNFLLLVLGMSVFQFGWAIPPIVRMPFLNWLGMSNAMIGLTGGAWLLSLIGNLLCPSLSRRFVRKKWFQFFVTIPYLCTDLLIGVAILLAFWRQDYTWLMPVTLILLFLWPFAAGWTVVPQSEYIANCIDKKQISLFVSAQQFGGALMGVAGATMMTYFISKFGTPVRYAFGFLFAFAIAFAAILIPLFAKENPVPQPPAEPFWRPAFNAAKNDTVFLTFLVTIFIIWFVVQVPFNFISLYAVREFGMPDEIAGVYGTAYTGATMGGSFLVGWLSRSKGLLTALIYSLFFFLFSMGILVLPLSGEMKQDCLVQNWSITADETIASIVDPIVLRKASKNFQITSANVLYDKVEHRVQIELKFNQPLTVVTFTENDIFLSGPQARRIKVDTLVPNDTTDRWTLTTVPIERVVGEYSFKVLPYIKSASGSGLDMNGNGRNSIDHYRFIIVGILYAIGFTGVFIVAESLMYLLAPVDKRAGYYAAYRIVQFLSPAIAFYMSGLFFVPGYYHVVFIVLGVAAIIAIPAGLKVLKPVQERVHKTVD